MMDVMWFDGALRHRSAIEVAPFTHALHYGSGVFEGLRAYPTARGPAVFRMRDHVTRLFASATAYGLQISFSADELARAIGETIRANAMGDGYIRPLVFFGESGISLAPSYHCPTHTLVALRPLNGSLIGGGEGAKVCVSPWRKTPSSALPSTVKACGHYMNSILALQEAYARGYHEAILLNDRGEVAEGTGENIFLVKNGRLHTNDARADILEGITRDTVIRIARDRGIPVDVAPITMDDIGSADELFFTGTAAEVMPIVQVDDRSFASNSPVTTELRRTYASVVRGQEPAYVQWLSYV
ncbi:MAG TPA: branched-chain amino acid transaminase [Candidatus Baltobacteraceae bacterium]|jgi:branched-chain amino acid aminotransferase|nr:branched-chain amino acid transaminase [Candidatus Baltobacteraceae bacterium]